MPTQENLVHLSQGSLHGRDREQDVRAGRVRGDHALEALDLPLDAAQASTRGGPGLTVEHSSLPPGGTMAAVTGPVNSPARDERPARAMLRHPSSRVLEERPGSPGTR